MEPRVTVIIPCYEDGELLLEAVASIREPVAVQIVVVDDASKSPQTVDALDSLDGAHVQVIHHERNRGLAEARNTGLAAAKAPYVFPLDSDDLAVDGALAAMAETLDRAPESAVCFGDYLEFGGEELIRAVPRSLDPYRIAYSNEYPVSSLFRREVLEEIGGWRHLGAGYEDWDLWMALAERGYRGVHLGEGRLTYRRRLHRERMLSAARREHRSLYRRLKADHALLFAQLAQHRRSSDMSLRRKLVYPLVYGGRPRFAFESKLKRLLDRLGVWTLRR
jgi:glycosyltransferase involved in cell wall biosynthesis